MGRDDRYRPDRLALAEWNARRKAGDDEAAQEEITARSQRRFVASARRAGMDEDEIAARVTASMVLLDIVRARDPDGWWQAEKPPFESATVMLFSVQRTQSMDTRLDTG